MNRQSLLFTFVYAGAIAASAAIASPPSGTTQPPATTPLKRDWRAYPAVLEVDTGQDIYAIGDMHGDYEKGAKLLAAAGLIEGMPASPTAVKWTGGKNVLVCTGDMIDKWNQGLEVVELMRALQSAAEKEGGRVVVTLGNHEAEFLASRGSDKKSAEFAQELLAKGINPSDVAAGKDAGGIGAWLRTRPVAARIDDWFFCHAGNTFGVSLKKLEQAVEEGVDKEGFGTFVLAEPNSILEARMGSVPWWMMTPASATGQAKQPEESNMEGGAATLKRYVAALGCKHLAVGHQPGKVSFGGGIVRKPGEAFAYEGVLFLLDVGMSRGVQDSRGAVLKIEHGAKERASTIDEAGQQRLLWSEP